MIFPIRELSDDGIDNYRVVRQLGSGGMGTVFLADQYAPVRRQVALKVIKLGMVPSKRRSNVVFRYGVLFSVA